MIPQKTVGRWLAMAGLLFIAAMTLVPHPELVEQVEQTPIACLICGGLGTEDIILNVLLFLPFGLGLRLTGLSRWKGLALVVLTTICVESLQLKMIAGRDASLSDLLTNTAGGWLGILLAEHWRVPLFARARSAGRLALGAAAAWLVIQGITVALVARSLPPTVYYGQWAPSLGQFDQFHGTVLKASLDGAPLPAGRLGNSAEVRRALNADSVVLETTVTGDVPDPALAPIVSIFDDQQEEILLLGRSGRDLVFRIRSRASDVRLRGPAIRLTDVLPPIPGHLVEISAGLRHGHLFISARTGGRDYRHELAMSPSWGWNLVLPYEYAFGPENRLLTALWVSGLLFPTAYWTYRSAMPEPRARLLGVLALLPLIGLNGIAAAVGLPSVHWSEWFAAGVGILAGWALGSVSRRTAQ